METKKAILITVLVLAVLVLKSTMVQFQVLLPEEALDYDVPEFIEGPGPQEHGSW